MLNKKLFAKRAQAQLVLIIEDECFLNSFTVNSEMTNCQTREINKITI